MRKWTSATAESGRPRLRSLLLVLGIVLLAANLRPALTGVAPLIGQIRADTGMSNGVGASHDVAAPGFRPARRSRRA